MEVSNEWALSKKVKDILNFAVLRDIDKTLFFITTKETFYLYEGTELIEERQGYHYLFATGTQIVICSEADEGAWVRIARYNIETYLNPDKVMVKLGKYLPLNTFVYKIDFVDVTSHKVIFNIIRNNTVLEKQESVISIFKICDNFKLRLEKTFILSPKIFGKVCMDTDMTQNIIPQKRIEGLDYKFVPYEECAAAFANERIYVNPYKLIYKNISENKCYQKNITGKILAFEKSETIPENVNYISYLEVITDVEGVKQVFLKFIMVDTKKYLSYFVMENVLFKYTIDDDIFLLRDDEIICVNLRLKDN